MWIINSYTTLVVCCAISPVFTVYRTYEIQAVFPANQLLLVQHIRNHKFSSLTEHRVFVNVTYLPNMTTGAVRMTLALHETQLAKYGDPIDIAQFAGDMLGFIRDLSFKPSKFQVNAPPPPPTSLSTSDITSDSITITWKRPKYFVIDFYQVQLSNSSNNATWQNFTKVNGSKEETTMNGLESDTNYFIRLQSANRHGIGARNSGILNVKTKQKTIASLTQVGVLPRDHVIIVVAVVIFTVVVILIIGMFIIGNENSSY